MRFDTHVNRWDVKDTQSGLMVMTNKHILWARDVRDAINNKGRPTYRARKFAQEWLTHLRETQQLAEEGKNEPVQ